MAMTDAKFIELCIPDSLRLAKHQDAELVNSAIATALLAMRKALRDNVWEKNIASDIARAMSGYMESVYVPHIAKEEEDWGKLQLEAEEARVMKAAQAEQASSAVDTAAIADDIASELSLAYDKQHYGEIMSDAVFRLVNGTMADRKVVETAAKAARERLGIKRNPSDVKVEPIPSSDPVADRMKSLMADPNKVYSGEVA